MTSTPTTRTSTRHVLREIWRRVAVVLMICVPVAGFFNLMSPGHFREQLVYSLCIGTLSMLCFIALFRGLGLALQWRWPQRFPNPRQAATKFTVVLLVVCTPVGYAAGLRLGGWLLGHHFDVWTAQDFRNTAISLVISLALGAVTSYVFYTKARLASLEAKAAAAQRSAVETQLHLLAAQLEPHMLFNTLANLRVLIGLDPANAQTMLDNLIDFLRATLQASRTGHQHTLAAEFARLNDYLALMQVRMGERLRYRFDLPSELEGVLVPPMLLQPLVENAVLHGLEPQIDGGEVVIGAECLGTGQQVQLTVTDNGAGLAEGALQPPQPTAGHGFGTTQIRERLATLFGDQARLDLAPNPAGGTTARVTLPLSRQAADTPTALQH